MNPDLADRLERERRAHVVREYRPAFDQTYLDLLAIAHEACRATDKPEEQTA